MTSKGAPWTEHVQAPLLARWDGVFPPGTTDDRLVGTEDYLPTFLDAAGYTPPQLKYPLDGRSFLPGRPDCPSQRLLPPRINRQLPLEEKTLAEYLKECLSLDEPPKLGSTTK